MVDGSYGPELSSATLKSSGAAAARQRAARALVNVQYATCCKKRFLQHIFCIQTRGRNSFKHVV